MSLRGGIYSDAAIQCALAATVPCMWIATGYAFAMTRSVICLIFLKNLLNLRMVENVLRKDRRENLKSESQRHKLTPLSSKETGP